MAKQIKIGGQEETPLGGGRRGLGRTITPRGRFRDRARG